MYHDVSDSHPMGTLSVDLRAPSSEMHCVSFHLLAATPFSSDVVFIVKQPFKEDEVVASYKALILRMPRPNQYLLLYVLDLLSVFARKCEKNLMTASSKSL